MPMLVDMAVGSAGARVSLNICRFAFTSTHRVVLFIGCQYPPKPSAGERLDAESRHSQEVEGKYYSYFARIARRARCLVLPHCSTSKRNPTHPDKRLSQQCAAVTPCRLTLRPSIIQSRILATAPPTPAAHPTSLRSCQYVPVYGPISRVPGVPVSGFWGREANWCSGLLRVSSPDPTMHYEDRPVTRGVDEIKMSGVEARIRWFVPRSVLDLTPVLVLYNSILLSPTTISCVSSQTCSHSICTALLLPFVQSSFLSRSTPDAVSFVYI
ncbi:hypothetical protein C8J57DRAFT_1705381 [Mycena rebaudengoi]|nr:hypothetical protein C8J57DRAFT_1705381 [Mycena rebaudengoi]